MSNDTNKKEKHFIQRPEYPGGKSALQKYLHENLRYPKEALEQKIEGVVRVWYEVDNGDVVDCKVEKSLSPSCDEEAIRLVKSLKYSRPKNRHLRVKSSFHININFRLKEAAQQVTLQYTQVQTPAKKEPSKTQNVYTYTINI